MSAPAVKTAVRAAGESRGMSLRLLALCLGGVLALTGSAIATFPARAAEADGFSSAVVADGLTVPVAIQFGPEGRIYVAEKFGAIKVIGEGGAVTTFGSLAVNGDFEQGLLGMVLDPDFGTNGYIYVAYTRPDGDFNRVSRITADPANPLTMLAGSEKVLLDGMPSPTGIHEMGELQIGRDGKLYVAVGDGAIDSQTSGRLDTLSGKILRINLDGSVPEDNPFVGQSGARPEIWAYGVRNPFSSSVQPSTGRHFFGDVGQDDWEEINELVKGGNYGWTQCEGRCQPARTGYVDPVYQYSHHSGEVVGRSVTGGAWYESGMYPPEFDGDYLFADYTSGWIKSLDPATGQVQGVLSDTPGIVNLEVGPDGLLYYARIDVTTGTGSINKLLHGAPPPAPGGDELKVYAAGSPAGGVGPTMEILVDDVVVATHSDVRGDYGARQFVEYVHVDAGTLTPDRVTIRFTNDAVIGGEDRNLHVDRIVIGGRTYESESPDTFTTGSWSADTGCEPGHKQSETLSCGGYFRYASGAEADRKPAASIETPVAETHYSGGQVIDFSGTGTDAEDGTLAAERLSWNVVFHHDTHAHPFLSFPETDRGSFAIPTSGETSADTFYRLNLTATDSAGQTTTVSRDIFPNVVRLTLDTDVAGLGLELDGQPKQAPHVFDAVVGMTRVIGAPAEQTLDGQTYDFVSWSDGGSASHTISTPAEATTYRATYEPRGESSVPPAPAGTVVKVYAAGSPAGGQYPTMEIQIDGATVGTFPDVRGDYGSRQFVEYTYTLDRVVGPSAVRINFPDDHFVDGEDRNLYVDRISLDGVPYETEAASTLSTGTWTADTGCGPGNKQSEVLSCSGYFEYGEAADPAPAPEPDPTGSVLTIHAAGSPADGVFPTMELQIAGEVVQTYTDVRGDYGSRTFVAYEYRSPTRLDVSQVQLAFPNDAMTATEDRNLYIDGVVLDGVRYEAEAPGNLSVGSWTADTGCAAGYKASEVLSCAGYLSFG